MSGQILLAHSIARRIGKPPFFFSRFNFERMKKTGNTHYCFHCGGHVGFKLDNSGGPINQIDEHGYNSMKDHDKTHTDAVVGNADKYDSVRDWLENSIPNNFPYLVTVPSV